MTEFLSPLLVGHNRINSALRTRRNKFTEKSISSKSKENLEEKAILEGNDGWEVLRKNMQSYRLGKNKPLDEQLEDALWCIAAKMGFDELSDGRNFTINVGEDVNPRQIDIFCKDRETAVFIECTCSEVPKRKRMTNLIEKIESIQPKVAQSVNAHYGKNPKLKLRWVIATRNIEWGDADLEKAKVAKIIVLRDQEIDYYSKLTEHLKSAAKYQFLSHIFHNESISGLDITVPATKGKMGGVTFYNFLIRPSDLLKIGYVSHKASRDLENLETYQRMLQPSRLKRIAKYIDEGGQFPTNIVVNIKSAKNGLRFDRKDIIGDSAFGTLYLPDKYASAWIIDGQHRLYGYAHSERANMPDDRTTLPVLAYENMSPSDEAQLFVNINCEQVRVAKGLLIEIYANLRWDSPFFEERIDALRSRVIMALDHRKTSAIHNRIKSTTKDKSRKRCLTLTSFNEGLKENKFFGEIRNDIFKPGPLSESRSTKMEDTLKKGVEILSGYLALFADAMPEHWAIGDGPSGYLCTNNGIRAILRVLKEVFTYIAHKHSIEPEIYDPDDLLPLIAKHTQPVVDYFKGASQDSIALFRSRQALQGVNKNSLMMMSLIHDSYKDFLPLGLQKYLETVDVEGTEEARSMMESIQERLFTVTIRVLKDHYKENEEQWWYEGIPETVRTECSKRCELDKGAKNREQYFFLIDYKTIAAFRWEDLFNKYYSFSKDGGKEKQLKWLVDLNQIRTITHHREKWPATKDQVAFVREIHAKVMEKFV
ncbi:MAG: DGQHR domain-containing protein [Pseudomonadota bacterium]